MASIAPKNYIKVAEDFAAHWALANAALGASPIILQGNYTLTTLGTDKTALAALINAVDVAANARQSASADRDIKRAAMRERLRQFRAMVQAAFPRSTYEGELDPLPKETATGGIWTSVMNQANDTWGKINAIMPAPVGTTIPMVLQGGYAKAAFVTDTAALSAAFLLVEDTQRNDSAARQTRDDAWALLAQRFRQYRLMVQARFPAGNAMIDSLPILSPAPGHTPDPVTMSALWDPALSKAVVTYTTSLDPDLASYQLRACLGTTKYTVDQEQVIATHPAGTVTPFQTDEGLVASGSKAFYKVYVMLSTGNEKGSKSVAVTRA
jgi:hypothetical protein